MQGEFIAALPAEYDNIIIVYKFHCAIGNSFQICSLCFGQQLHVEKERADRSVCAVGN
jgi:hypothetical protein